MPEPIVTLPDGTAVLRASLDTFDALLATGHALCLNPDGDFAVAPADLHPDVEAVIATNLHDFAALAAALLREQ